MTENENSTSCAQNQSGTDGYIDHHDWFSNDVASNMVLAFGSLERFFVNLKRHGLRTASIASVFVCFLRFVVFCLDKKSSVRYT